MIEEDVPIDRRHDEFYERFMEQRFQKINNPGQSSTEDSLDFLLNLFVQLLLHSHINESVTLAVTLELILLMFYPQQCHELLTILSPVSYHQLHE